MGPMPGVVTISASFGASGDAIGRAVAEQLGVPFFDRAVPAAVAANLALPVERVLDHDETAPSAFERLARSFAYASTSFGPEPIQGGVDDPNRFCQETERILHEIADTTGGVVLGRAGMVVLRNRPDALRVRLDGPVEERIGHVVRVEHMPEDTARSMQREIDGAREAYARVFYRARQSDPSLYQAIFEVTSLGAEACSAAIAALARRRLAPWLSAP
jgi:cytidylate kinase